MIRRRLVLRAETVRMLGEVDLRAARGGLPPASYALICATYGETELCTVSIQTCAGQITCVG